MSTLAVPITRADNEAPKLRRHFRIIAFLEIPARGTRVHSTGFGHRRTGTVHHVGAHFVEIAWDEGPSIERPAKRRLAND